MKLAALVMSSLMVVSGCQTAEYNHAMMNNLRPATASEISILLDGMRRSYVDPYSLRDVEISNVATSMGLDGVKTSMICVRANAKNRMGAYSGQQTTLYYFAVDGKIRSTNQDMFAQQLCNNLQWRRFDEAAKLRSL